MSFRLPENAVVETTRPITDNRLSLNPKVPSMMNPSHLLSYRDLTVSCLEKQLSLLQAVEQLGLILPATGDDNHDGLLTREELPERRAIVEGEIHKLKHFDVVLAVVGTMKAGKSTTINAIVGREILPNRNRPMTALPTQIVHVAGQTTPKLRFNNPAVQQFAGSLKTQFAQHPDWQQHPDLQEDNIQALIAQLQSGWQFEHEYLGEDAIFEFLRSLNDLVRLAEIIQNQIDNSVGFPYHECKNINQLPVIEVAFFYLQDKNVSQGNLILLDTPGPNEAGQNVALRKMLDEQLNRSSAVLLVLDYTQLKSEASDSVKQQLLAMPTLAQDRLFALVNRYDARDAHSDDAETVKDLVFNDFLKDKVLREHIFPVSARHAYLSNRMLRTLEESQDKPEFVAETWVEDFAKMALGVSDAEDWADESRDKIAKRAQKRLDESLMLAPIEQAIAQTHRTAPMVAIRSALANVGDLVRRLNAVCELSMAAAKAQTDAEHMTLQRLLLSLQVYSGSLKQLESDFTSTLQQLSEKGLEHAKRQVAELEKNIVYEVDRTFGKMIDDAQQSIDDNSQYVQVRDYLRKMTTQEELEKQQTERIRAEKLLNETKDGKLVFTSEAQRDDFLQCCQQIINQINQTAYVAANAIIRDSLKLTYFELSKVEKEMQQIVGEVQAAFQQNAMDIELAIPSLQHSDKHLIQIEEYVYQREMRHEEKTEVREKDGALAWVARKMWRGGKLSVKLDYWTDDKEQLRNNMIENIQENVLRKIRSAVAEQFILIEHEYVKGNLHTISQITNQLKNQLKQSFEFNQRNAHQIEQVRSQIIQINSQNQAVKKNLDALRAQFR